MTPRRPSPARPGTRPGPRTAVRPHPGERATANKTKEPAAAASPAPPSDTESAAYQQTVLRVGGPEGIAVPARILILAVVLLGAFVVTFPSLRGYLSQQAQYDSIVKELDQARATSTSLEAELAQWQDDDYVRSQARERLSYVMPGETTYVVIGAEQFEDEAEHSRTGAADGARARPWYETLQESVQEAGGTR